jgi:adenylate cyclase
VAPSGRRRTRRSLFIPFLALALATVTLAHAAGWMPLALFARIERLLDDVRLQAFAPHGQVDAVVIVDIDDRSLAEIGRWPWNRDRMAALVDELVARQRVAAIGFDFVFPEPQSVAFDLLARAAAGEPLLEPWLPQWRQALDHDGRFADALRGRPVVLGCYFSSDRGGQQAGQLPAPLFTDTDLGGRRAALPRWNGFGANLPLLATAAPAAGCFNALPDEDGVERSLPLVMGFDGHYHASLALAVWQMATGKTNSDAAAASPTAMRPVHHPSPADESAVDLVALDVLRSGHPPRRLPLDARGAAVVPFRAEAGPVNGAFRYVSAADVLNGRLAEAELAGRIVLVGTSAPGLGDLRATPVHASMPGVEVHAHLIAGLLDGRFDGGLPVHPGWARGFEAASTLALLGASALIVWLASPAMALAAGLVLVGAFVAANLWAYQSAGWLLPLAWPVSTALLMLAAGIAQGYVIEWRGRRALTSMFGSYVPPEVVRQMAAQGMSPDMHAENRELTLLFCDLRGFSAIAETLEPQALRSLINLYFSSMSQIVLSHGGTLDKFIGDAVMAFWGAPIADPLHARHALAAAEAMTQAIAPLNEQLRERGLPPVSVGVGVATGTVCVGDLGSDLRRSYTAVGDAVNIAARIEALTRSYGIDLLVAESTRDACGPGAAAGTWVEVDRVKVKGRERPVTIFTLIPEASATAVGVVPLLRHWELALAAQRSQHPAQALDHLRPLMWAEEPPPRLRALAETMSLRLAET